MKTGNDFCTVENFKKVFLNSAAGEFELNFNNTKDLYMINKEDDKFVFLKCNSKLECLYYADLDELLKSASLEGFNVIENWQYLWAIVIDGTYDFEEYCENNGL